MTVSSRGCVVIVGNPNVGKSVLFNLLTGAHATVSNYPGTTVEVMKGHTQCDGTPITVIDTPGMYSLLPITAEEQIARKILMDEAPALVIHVVDAKNIERMLPLTIQLIEFGFPVLLDVNMIDEAERIGLAIDADRLSRELAVPVVLTALTAKRGFGTLMRKATEALRTPAADRRQSHIVRYDTESATAIDSIAALLQAGQYRISPHGIAQLLLQHDEEIIDLVRTNQGAAFSGIMKAVDSTRKEFSIPAGFLLARARREAAMRILNAAVQSNAGHVSRINRLFDRLTMDPLLATPFLALVLFLFY